MMNMMKKLLALLWAVAAAVSFAQQAPPMTTEDKTEVLNSVNKIMEDNAFVPGVDFKKWPDYLAKEQAAIDDAKTPVELAQAVNRALHTFGASHIVLSTPEQSTARKNQQNVGIGIQIQPEDKGVRIMAVFPGSAADEAKLMPGDLITKADGKDVHSAVELQGASGSTVELLITRKDKEQTFKITRRPYSNRRPESLTWVDKETAMLKVWTFDLGYDRDNVEKLMKEASGAKRLILDLRYNPGGAVTNMLHLLGLLMPQGTSIGHFLSRGDVDRYVKETGGKPTDWKQIAEQSRTELKAGKNPRVDAFKGKIAVLVNGGSGSAAEIAAAALQEELDAPVLGNKSAGAVLASIVRPIAAGFALQYPVMDYVTPKGRRLEGNGVIPLIETAAVTPYGEKDEAVERATVLLARLEKIGSN